MGADERDAETAPCASLHDAIANGSVADVAALLAVGHDVNGVNDDGRAPLVWACYREKNSAMVECLLDAGAALDARDEWGMTPFLVAADHGDVDLMALLVRRGADVHAHTEDERSALHLSAQSGSADAVAFVLHHDVAVDATDDAGWSAIHSAARKGDIRTMAMLIEHGADVLSKTEDGRSTLYLSAQQAKAEAIAYLLAQGVPVATVDNFGWSALHAAAESGDVRTMQILVDHGADVHARTREGRSTLFMSALDGEYEAVRFLLDSGVAVDTRDNDGWTALIAAAENGDVRTLSLLVEHGANIHAQTALRRSALFIAAFNGNAEAVKYLLDLGLAVNATDADGWSTLHAAADCGDVDTINLLVSYGADIEALTTDGRSTLYLSAVYGNTDAAQYFLTHGVTVDPDDDDMIASLNAAAGRGDVRTMALLVEHGAGLYTQTTDGQSTLFAGALDGEYEAVKFLLDRGADVSATDENGWSALLLAAQSGDVKTIELLAEHGADVHARTPDGQSALYVSAWSRHGDAVKYFLDHGVELELTDEIGWTALLAAARRGDVHIMTLLIDHGADRLARAADGRTALFLSALKGSEDAVQYLLEQGVPVDTADDKGWTALHAAARKGSVSCMKLLVEFGANAQAVTQFNSSILHIAAHRGRIDAVEYALELGLPLDAVADNEGKEETPLTLAIQSDDHELAYRITFLLCSRGAAWKDVFLRHILDNDHDDELPDTDWRRQRRQWRAGLCACAGHWAEEYLDTGAVETKVPIEVVERGEVSVRTYLADVARSQHHELIHRCKICVVGPSEWGKTSLVLSLQSNVPTLTQQKDRTIGIALVSCVLDGADGSKYEITFWDFAGQDVYHVAHSLFYSRRTLYVLVVDLEAYDQQLRVAQSKPVAICEAIMDRFLRSHVFRWVRRILAHQPDARFTVVGTKVDRLTDASAVDEVRRDLEDRLKAWKATLERDTSDATDETSASTSVTLPSDWLVVDATKLDTIAAARGALQQTITLHELGFPMWKTYARVQRAVATRREQARRIADAKTRMERSMILFKTLRNQLVDEFDGLDADECEQILRTLNDLGDVLWYEHDGAGVLKDFIILDPMLVIDVVREVIRHDFAGSWPRDGRIAHDRLCTFSMWKAMDMELMHAFKSLLQHFQLAYPADDDIMHPESDLIVPTYWQVARSASSRSLLATQSIVVDTFGDNWWCWEYDLSRELSETIFEQFAVQSHSAHLKRTIRGACIEATCDEFASSITLVQPTHAAYDTIRIEVGGATVDASWHTMRFYLMKLEKVLERYIGAVVERNIIVRAPDELDEQRKPVHRVARAIEDAISLGKDEHSVRALMPWMPPDMTWYLTRAWNNITSFQQLQMTRQIQDKLDVVRKLAIAGSAPRFPALWSLEHRPNEHKVVLRVSSDLSGRCYHVPMEIDTGSPLLAKHGAIIKDGLSIFSTVASEALSFPIMQTVIDAAKSGLEGSIDHAQRVHNLIDRLRLPSTDSLTFDSRANSLAPGVATAVLRDLLTVYNDSSDALEISEITNLECAVTATGEYVWAHAHEIAMLGNQLTRCAAPPSTWAALDEPEPSPSPSLHTKRSSSNNSSSTKLQLALRVDGIDGLADWDWHKVYCTWQLLYGETQRAPIASGATAQHADGSSPPSWRNVTTAIASVATWDMLRECRLAVQVKRRSRIGWTKFIGEGSVALHDVIDDAAEQPRDLAAIRVPLDATASRVVTIQLSLEN